MSIKSLLSTTLTNTALYHITSLAGPRGLSQNFITFTKSFLKKEIPSSTIKNMETAYYVSRTTTEIIQIQEVAEDLDNGLQRQTIVKVSNYCLGVVHILPNKKISTIGYEGGAC